MIGRLLTAIVVGLVAALVAAVVIFIIGALLPGFEPDVWFWAGIVGLLFGLIYLFTGNTPSDIV